MTGAEDAVRGTALELVRDLSLESEVVRSLRQGTIDRGIYEALLVQLHKIESALESIASSVPDALALAGRAAGDGEREDHPRGSELIAADLEALWSCPRAQVFVRLDAVEPSPAVVLLVGVFETILERYPWTVVAPMVLLDEVSAALRDPARELHARRPWPEVERTTSFLERAPERLRSLGGASLLEQVATERELDAVIMTARTVAHLIEALFEGFAHGSGRGVSRA